MKSRPGRYLLRFYFAHERLLLGVLVVFLFLVAWEGLGRGWWADLLAPLLGKSAEALRLKPILISSPSAVAKAVYTLYFVTGEIWPILPPVPANSPLASS